MLCSSKQKRGVSSRAKRGFAHSLPATAHTTPQRALPTDVQINANPLRGRNLSWQQRYVPRRAALEFQSIVDSAYQTADL